MRFSLLAAAIAAVFASLTAAEPAESGVELFLIDGVRNFPEATDVGAIRRACAPSTPALASFFAERKLAFDEKLVRGDHGFRACHVFYEPTLPGFKTLPDDRPIQRLYGSVDPDSFVARGPAPGDSLEIFKTVLSQLERPIDVTLGVTDDYDPARWPESLAYHFGDSPHRFELKRSEAENAHPWAQDYIKAGEWNGELRILVPRRLFEGRAADGETYRPLLDALQGEGYVRSKLSWEGGDLQFTLDPRDPSRRILFHGGVSRLYWGQGLSAREISYVLKTEFGADHAIDLSAAGPHVDFLVAFLPRDRRALVSRPVHGDLKVALAAARELGEAYQDRAPPEVDLVVRLLEVSTEWAQEIPPEDADRILRYVEALKRKLPATPSAIDPRLTAELDRYIDAQCPHDPKECFTSAGKRRMYELDPKLLQRTLQIAVRTEAERALGPKMLAVIETQLAPGAGWNARLLDQAAQEIRSLGFRVQRVPYIVAPELVEQWPGLSYVNLLAFDRTLFVPAFGLGPAEEAIFEEFQKNLPKGYTVVPVPARASLLLNGGVHCVFGIVRDPSAR